MEQFVRSITARTEFFIVIGGAFGYLLLGNILSLFLPKGNAPISESQLQSLLVYESLLFIALGGFLLLRGWKIQQIGFPPKIKDAATGIGLAILAYAFYTIIWIAFSGFIPGIREQAAGLVTPNLSLITVLTVSVVNSIFEEVFVCGYVIAALKKSRSDSFAINVSIAIRLAYHLYQGPVAVISIIPLGLVFAHWFAKTHRIGPVVVAHGLFDFIGLVAYVQL